MVLRSERYCLLLPISRAWIISAKLNTFVLPCCSDYYIPLRGVSSVSLSRSLAGSASLPSQGSSQLEEILIRHNLANIPPLTVTVSSIPLCSEVNTENAIATEQVCPNAGQTGNRLIVRRGGYEVRLEE